MNDAAVIPSAWNVPPDAYVTTRSATFGLPQPSSCYVAIRDGCRLAVDVYLPQPAAGAQAPATFPTIAVFTPYYRRFKLRAGGQGDPNPNSGKFRDFFVP